MSAYDASAWTDLCVASAGASAALAGLVFVAVSINIERILQFPWLPARALETVLLLVGALLAALLTLAPQSRTALGVELLVEGLAVAGVLAVLVARNPVGADSPHAALAPRLLPLTVGAVPFAVAGATLLAQAGGGLYWLLAGTVGALLAAVLNAWVLLVEILR